MNKNERNRIIGTYIALTIISILIGLFVLCPKSHGVENPYQGLNIPDIPERIDPREVLELRSNSSFTLDNGDGTYTGFFYGSQIFNVPAEEKQNLIARLFSVVVPDATATTTDYYGESSSGYINGHSPTSYSAAHTSSDTCVTTTSTAIPIGQSNSEFTGWDCWRGYLEFVTSGLSGYAVSQANVYIKTKSNNSDTDFDIRLMHDNWTEALCSNTESNFDDCLSASTYTLWKSTSTWVNETYYGSSNITTSWVNTSGSTYFSIISSRDDAGTEPAQEILEYVSVYSPAYTGTSKDPYLEVVYSDVTAPTPNPATFSSAPAGASTSSISMTSTTGSDVGTVSYQFVGSRTNADGCNDGSGYSTQSWSTTKTFTDGGLDANHRYGYTVQMRDNVPNTGTASAVTYAYTLIETLAIVTYADAEKSKNDTTIFVKSATTHTNLTCGSSGLYFENTTNGTNSGWLTTNRWDAPGLLPDSLYSFRVKARNGDGIETGYYSAVDYRTYPEIGRPPTVNNPTSTTIDVNVVPGDNPAYTMYSIGDSLTGLFVQANGTLAVDEILQTDAAWGTITVTGLTPATTYYFYVDPYNQEYESNEWQADGPTAAQTTLSEGGTTIDNMKAIGRGIGRGIKRW